MMASILALSTAANASVQIRCEEGDVQVGLLVDGFNSVNPPKTTYVIYKDGEHIGSGVLTKAFEGYEDQLLNAYIWAFEKNKGVVSVGSTEITEPTVGEWQGSADIYLETETEVVDMTTAPCTITISE